MKLVLTSLPVGTRVRTNGVTCMGEGVDGYWQTGTLVEKRGDVAIVLHDNGSRCSLQAGCILEELPA